MLLAGFEESKLVHEAIGRKKLVLHIASDNRLLVVFEYAGLNLIVRGKLIADHSPIRNWTVIPLPILIVCYLLI